MPLFVAKLNIRRHLATSGNGRTMIPPAQQQEDSLKWIGKLAVGLVGVTLLAWLTFRWWGLPLTSWAIGAFGPDVPLITSDEVSAFDAPLWIDARDPAEFEISHVEGALNIVPRATDTQILTALEGQAKDRFVVVYCSVGARSATFGSRLIGLGFIHVANLRGGLFEWANAGQPMVDASGQPTTLVHPFNSSWGRLLDDEHLPRD